MLGAPCTRVGSDPPALAGHRHLPYPFLTAPAVVLSTPSCALGPRGVPPARGNGSAATSQGTRVRGTRLCRNSQWGRPRSWFWGLIGDSWPCPCPCVGTNPVSLSPSLAHGAPSREVALWGSPCRAPSPWPQGATGRQPWPRMAALGGTRPPGTFAPCHRACSWQDLGTEGRGQGSSRTPHAATSRNSVTDREHTQTNGTQSTARSLRCLRASIPAFAPTPGLATRHPKTAA